MKKKRAGYLEGSISVIANVCLFALKYWAGIVSGSVALMADAWHTLSDSISSIIVLAGTKLSGKKADQEHPYGHGRWEQVASIFIAVLLAIVAFDFVMESVDTLRERESANFGSLSIIIIVVSIVSKEGLAQYAFFLAKKSNNTTVKADAWHHRSDALSSFVILSGIFLSKYLWWIDAALGMIISLFLFYAVYGILKEAVNSILGKRPPDKLINEIKALIKENENKELFPHQFLLHEYGSHWELTFHIQIDGDRSISEAHHIATHIETMIQQELDISTTIHMEPNETSQDKTN
ncbi:MAG: cation diffusion facilitator family transporter [Bacteroidales bacterium]